MPDVGGWIHEGMMTRARKRGVNDFEAQLQVIVAEEMSSPANEYMLGSGKIDVLHLLPLRRSATKKAIFHVHAHLFNFYKEDIEDRMKAIGRRVKKLLDLPEDEQCVAVCFYEVGAGHWTKV